MYGGGFMRFPVKLVAISILVLLLAAGLAAGVAVADDSLLEDSLNVLDGYPKDIFL
jgi:hypothetical protein